MSGRWVREADIKNEHSTETLINLLETKKTYRSTPWTSYNRATRGSDQHIEEKDGNHHVLCKT